MQHTHRCTLFIRTLQIPGCKTSLCSQKGPQAALGPSTLQTVCRDWLCDVGQVPDLPGLPVGHSSPSLPTLRGASAAPSPCSVPLGPLLQLPSSDLTAVGPPPHFCLHGQPGFSEGLSADADFTSSSSSPAGPRSLTSTTTHPEGSVRSLVPSTHVTSSVGSFSYQPDCMVTFPRPPSS